MSRYPTVSALAILVGVATSCGSPPRPVAVTATPTPEKSAGPVAVAETPAPPPKPCKELGEECKASSDTKARIGSSNLVFRPAQDWLYAQGDSVTVAQVSEGGACLAAASYEIGTPGRQGINRDATFDVLANRLAVKRPKRPVNWARPDEKLTVEKLQVSMWEVPGANRGGSSGPILIFEAPLDQGRALLGIGFVPDDDKTNADSILNSVKTLAPDSAESPSETASEKPDAKEGKP